MITVEVRYASTNEIMHTQEFENAALASEFVEIFNAGHKRAKASIRVEIVEVQIFRIKFTTLNGTRMTLPNEFTSREAAESHAASMVAWQNPTIAEFYDYRPNV